MAAYFASKIVWRLCPTTKSTAASTKLMLKRNMKKLTKGLNPSEAQLKGKLAPARNIHKSTNNAKMSRFEDEMEFMNEMMQGNAGEDIPTFKQGTRYHLSDTVERRPDANVVKYLVRIEKGRRFTFPQLQPANQRSLGSIAINYDSEVTKLRPMSIVYPPVDTKGTHLEAKRQPLSVANAVKSSGKLGDVNKKNYTTSAKNLHPVAKTKIPADVPVINANCNRIAEILQRTYKNNYTAAIKKICSIHEEAAETSKKMKSKTKTKLTFSINSPRTIKSSRQSLLNFSKVEKPTNDSLMSGQSSKNYNTSATSDKTSIEYVQLCTPQTEKKLAKLKSSGCPPYIPTPAMTDLNLKRLNKQDVPEPPKICPALRLCPPRADTNLEVKQKRLPSLEAKKCEGVKPTPLKDVSPLKRLNKGPVVHERPCPPVLTCRPRADEGLQISAKKLPNVPVSACPLVEPEPLKDASPLIKLKKGEVKEPLKICIQEKCPPRADEGLTIPMKKLPDIPSTACPCSEPEPMREGAPLKRLNKSEVEQPQRNTPCVQETCLPRADDGLTVPSKKLQDIPPKFCPCIEPEPLKEGAPIKRLKKNPVAMPERICIQEECPVKEPEKIEQRSLPKIHFNDCPPVEIPTVRSAPQLKRLEKIDIPEPQKECPKESCEQNPRADRDCWAFIKHLNVTNTESNDCHGKRKYSTCVRTEDLSNNSHSVTVNNSNNSLFNPIDFVNFIIYKSNHRQIGTTQNLIKNEDYLQPCWPIIPEKESYIPPFDKSSIGPNKHLITIRDNNTKELYEDETDNDVCFSKKCQAPNTPPVDERQCRRPPLATTTTSTVEQVSLWQRVVNYFKARPGCPTPEELRMKRLKEKAKRAAEEAGLCLYDPKKCEISGKK